MNTRKTVIQLVLVLAVMGAASASWAAPTPKDVLVLSATTSAGGSVPTIGGGGNAANIDYSFTRTSCTNLDDTLNISIKIDNGGEESDPGPYIITLSATGDTSSILSSLPTPFSVDDDSVPYNFQIPISATGLAPGDYAITIHIDTDPNSSKIEQPNPKQIHVLLHVDPCDGIPPPTCFFTDSDGEFLTDCNGLPVSEAIGGRFSILNNKGKVISTNPGQFYYNYIWTNTGAETTVKIVLGPLSSNLVPQGANAVHAATFDAAGFDQSVANFEMVNQDGTPCGPTGPCTVTVGANKTLWVTWHLEFKKGLPTGAWGNSCSEAAANITATAKLVDPGDNSLVIAPSCGTAAAGYNKK